MKKGLTNYLLTYYKLQQKILLVHHPTSKSSWNTRHFYLSPDYNPVTPYNHRSILDCEVVIEYDLDNPKENLKLVNTVIERLKKHNIEYSKWDSGNKSTHLHILVCTADAKNLTLLKKTFIRFITDQLPIPDLRLAVQGHLVRAEGGVHEKTNKKKRLIHQTIGYGTPSILPQEVWDRYTRLMGMVIGRKVTMDLNDLVAHPGLKYILKAEEFRSSGDGHERALFMLIHVLKPKYKNDKKGLISYLQDWYRYSGGRQLSTSQIENKVHYHWNRNYKFGKTFINELLESIGKEELAW